MALTMGLVFVSCDKEKEDDVKSYTLSVSLNKADSIYLGTDTSTPVGYYFKDDIKIDPFIIDHSFGSWGFGEGFTFTSCANDTTPGYTNLSAITKKGVKTNAYFIANTGSLIGSFAEISFKDGKAYNAKECYVTNSTYAYLAIKDQNDGAGYVKEWTNDDKFTLTITGYNGKQVTGSVKVLLADGKNIINTWQQVDLTGLGKVTKLSFSLLSTDQVSYDEGVSFYLNTPSYFCLDQLTVTE